MLSRCLQFAVKILLVFLNVSGVERLKRTRGLQPRLVFHVGSLLQERNPRGRSSPSHLHFKGGLFTNTPIVFLRGLILPFPIGSGGCGFLFSGLSLRLHFGVMHSVPALLMAS